jgi:hypothetical protein
VVMAVDLGQVAQLGGAQLRLGGEEAPADGLRAQLREPVREQGLVRRADRPHADHRAGLKCDKHGCRLQLTRHALRASRHTGAGPPAPRRMWRPQRSLTAT